MHEDLLGYLLGALEPHEMERVAQLLREDPEARRQLAAIERSLQPLDDALEPIEPPPADLIARTLDALPPFPANGESVSAAGDSNEREDSSKPVLIPMQSGIERVKNGSSVWIDWASGAVAAVVLMGLLLPSLAEGRLEARKVACQDHLRQLGIALQQYVDRNQQGRLPDITREGPEAFAGIYSIRLAAAGLLDDASVRWCPSIDQANEDTFTPATADPIVSLEQLHQASVSELKQIQRQSGGHYAYSLGVWDENYFGSPRFESRTSFAVMSDAPMIGIGGGELSAARFGHRGTGINVLFEDGRVQFIPLSALGSIPDHPLVNHLGRIEAGVNVDDASLGASWQPPFLEARQR